MTSCVLEIFDPLSLSVKLHHCIYVIFRVWPQLLIEIKKWKLLQICRHECNGLSKPSLVLTVKNCSKLYDNFNPLFTNQIKKRIILLPTKILKPLKNEKTYSFCVHEQKNLKCYFLEKSSLTTHLEY